MKNTHTPTQTRTGTTKKKKTHLYDAVTLELARETRQAAPQASVQPRRCVARIGAVETH
jgi:hypothetical protein